MMNRRFAKLARSLAPAAFALLALPASAAAQMESSGSSLELFGSHSVVYSSSGGFTFHAESLGVRGAFRFTSVWAVEAALSRSNGDHPIWNGDVSAKAYVFRANRFALYALAGPGVHHEELAGRTDDASTVHAGIGTEIALGERAYLRPQILTRWLTSHLNDRGRSVDYTLGFGWRF
jgi:hypothetical protein